MLVDPFTIKIRKFHIMGKRKMGEVWAIDRALAELAGLSSVD